MGRLWDKGDNLNEVIHAFTVGNDPEIDLAFVGWDTIGSAAHAWMLNKIGILSDAEVKSLIPVLKEIKEKAEEKEFAISVSQEDCHTAIENYLVEKLGDVGRKIHAGRSRNDQVIVAVRLYVRHQVLELLKKLELFARIAAAKAEKDGDQVMPGYTHFQKAMPSSIGMWLHAFMEQALELMQEGFLLLHVLDKNPLGAGSGFGTTLGLDRNLTAELLGFSRVQRSPIDVQNSRGRLELKFLRWVSDIGSMIEKLSLDMILYSSEEFGFVSIPKAFTTGSSIMPQKRNPDVLELLRARASKLRGAEAELAHVISKMPSNYHRDFQYTKEPVLKAATSVTEMINVMTEVVSSFTVNKEALEKAMTPELYATYEAFREVRKGTPFRDAYKKVADKLDKGQIKREDLTLDFDVIQAQHKADLKEACADLESLSSEVKDWDERLKQVESVLLSA